MLYYDRIKGMRDELDLMLQDMENEAEPEVVMTLDQFSEYLVDPTRALVLAKQAGIGHSVFYGILKGDRRTMRAGNVAKLLSKLNIRLTQ